MAGVAAALVPRFRIKRSVGFFPPAITFFVNNVFIGALRDNRYSLFGFNILLTNVALYHLRSLVTRPELFIFVFDLAPSFDQILNSLVCG